MQSRVTKDRGARAARTIVAVAVSTLVLGATAACTAESTGSSSSGGTPITVETGDAPNQDVIPLYTDQDAAIEAAVKNLPGHVEEALDRTGVPGAQVAVVSGGETVYQGSFGVRDVTTEEKVDDDTLFMIASLSKPVSGTVVAKAITEDPDLSWSTPVKDLMPDFTMGDPYVTDNAQIGDYFTHRTGIPTGGGDDLEDVGFDRDYILAHLNQIPLAPFRITYQYSNFGLTTGAEAVAVSRGATWEQTAEELLFEPLGMDSTTSSHADFLAADNRAVQHARLGDKDFQPEFDRDPDAEAPAGGIASTAGDLAKWMNLVLADGELDGEAFIDPATMTQAFSAQIVSSHNQTLDQRPGHYGFGVNVGSGAGGRVVLSHSGGFGLGTATAASMVPDLDLGIVVLTNGAPIGAPEAVAQEFLDDVLYGAQTRDWVELTGGYFEHFNAPAGDLVGEEAPTDAAASGPASDYVGTYESPYFGTLTITEEGGSLQGAMGPEGDYTFAIEPWDGDTMAFAPTGENALPGSLSSAVFARGGAGVSGVTLTYFNQYPQVEEPSGLGVFTRVG
ncbi:serine hydrolase [Agromyces aureus]|uniref:Serine hydrolase n=1 Tax=Agromyces aureus TaxID=453304 RepID=A0A191WI91_9MICO|nr:serine hydrolase [Agromyces aureus]ANJ27976.1 serine hydrolase [Agromyces aureus]